MPNVARKPKQSTWKTSMRRSWSSWHFIRGMSILPIDSPMAVTDHATPVGSGTVARTKRIPVEQRAEAAGHRLDAPSDDRV